MTNQTQGRKKSNFPAQTTIPNNSTFDFVINGTNYKILDTDFYSALGVTGTLTQLGSTTSVPVLDKAGSVNRIRNLEAGNGINVGVSAYNGAKISHNFVNGTGGLNLIKDPNVTQPIIRNIQAGAGISASVDDDTDSIIVALSGGSVATKTVTVSSLSDLPSPVSGVITLADDTDYLFLQDISTANRFVINGTTSIRSVSSRLITLTYTGTGDMFTCTSPTLKIQDISLSCGSGTLFNVSGGGAGTVQLVEVNIIACDTIGTLDALLITRFHSVAFENIATNGFTFTGTHSNLFFDTCIIFLNGGTFINLGTATFTSLGLENQIVQSSAGGTTFLSGAASSANLSGNSIGKVTNCSISGSATPLSGISTADAKWEFHGNDDIQNTRADALLSMQGNATNTTISVAGTPVLVAGTWVVEGVSQMTATTAGRATYDGVKSIRAPINASVSIEPVSGGSVSLTARIAINGIAIANSRRIATASSGNPTSITVPWQVTLNPGDYVEVFVTNDTNTIDVLVSAAVLRVD